MQEGVDWFRQSESNESTQHDAQPGIHVIVYRGLFFFERAPSLFLCFPNLLSQNNREAYPSNFELISLFGDQPEITLLLENTQPITYTCR